MIFSGLIFSYSHCFNDYIIAPMRIKPSRIQPHAGKPVQKRDCKSISERYTQTGSFRPLSMERHVKQSFCVHTGYDYSTMMIDKKYHCLHFEKGISYGQNSM
jgi:hypothetical protein